MYFIVLNLFLNGPPLFLSPHLTKIFLLSIPIIVASRDPGDKNKTENTLHLSAWASPVMLLSHSLWTFYGNSFPGEPSAGFTQPRAEESSASHTPCWMHWNRRLSLPMGRTRRKSSHLHPYNTAGSVLFLRQIHQLPWHHLQQKARQDLAPNQRPHRCAIQVTMSVCLCWGRAKSWNSKGISGQAWGELADKLWSLHNMWPHYVWLQSVLIACHWAPHLNNLSKQQTQKIGGGKKAFEE